jgi:protein-S-isoprenylcysteine O-methyltransferase Ste14
MSAGRTAWLVAKTAAYLIAFWAMFLFALPIGISIVEIAVGIQRFPPMPIVAGGLLLISTMLAVWSAMMLAVAGRGTPLPFDPPRQLVTTGPYAYTRHPFATAATAQIVALGIALGSVPVLAYASAALAAWYFVIRPHEERVLEARFGDEARAYRAHVRAFRPRLKPYRHAAIR